MTRDTRVHVLDEINSRDVTSARAVDFTPDPALSFWPTPDDVANDLVYQLLEPWHGLGGGVRVLEPSAGAGHLVHAIQHHLPDADITAVEPSAPRAATLRTLPGVHVVESTLEAYQVEVSMHAFAGQWEPYDLVIMNPPFTLDGRPEAWAEHVLTIYSDPYLLKPGGVIGAIVPRIVMTGKSKRVRALRDLVGGVEECEQGAFDCVGAQVSTALMWIQKPLVPA